MLNMHIAKVDKTDLQHVYSILSWLHKFNKIQYKSVTQPCRSEAYNIASTRFTTLREPTWKRYMFAFLQIHNSHI